MTSRFPYVKLTATPTQGFPEPHVYQPLLPVTLSNPTTRKTLRYIALVDSGADFCLFHGLIGEALGLEVRAGAQHAFGGVTSRGNRAFVHQIDLFLAPR